MEVNLDDFIPAEYEVHIKETIQKVGGEKLKPIKEALPKEIDYMMIKAVLMKYHT
jgi:ATP-dependent DNA helicase RecQ